MPKVSEKTDKKITTLLNKLLDDVVYNEFLHIAKDELSSLQRHTKPVDLDTGTADKNSIKSFLESDFYELPTGITCPKCFSKCCRTKKYNGKRVCLSCTRQRIHIRNLGLLAITSFIVPPKTSSPINFIVTVQRMSTCRNVGADALKLLRDFLSTCPTLPNLEGHVQFVMPPIGSVGSGLASYRDMINACRDEKGTTYSPICDLVYMLTAVIRNSYDKVTIVASNISSITCKPSNLVELLEDFQTFKIPPEDVSFLLGGFVIKDGSVSCNPLAITGRDMLNALKTKQNTPWIMEMKMNCFARTFVDGLGIGRNCTGILEEFLSPDQVILIQNEISEINKEDESKEDD